MRHIITEEEFDATIADCGALRELAAFYSFSSRIRIEANALDIGTHEYKPVAAIEVVRNRSHEHYHDAIYDENAEFVEAFICESLEEYKAKFLELVAKYDQAPDIAP